MSGDDEGPAFRLPLNVPNDELDPETTRKAMEWLQALAEQLAAEDGKTLSIQVTGVYVDDYDDDDDGTGDGGGDDEGGGGGKAVKREADQKKAAVNFMVCPGRRPYG
jgi:hypothetical protein